MSTTIELESKTLTSKKIKDEIVKHLPIIRKRSIKKKHVAGIGTVLYICCSDDGSTWAFAYKSNGKTLLTIK